jgi:hypothetical protein
MKVTIEPSDKIVLIGDGLNVLQARVWQGETEDGTPVHLFVPRIAVAEGLPVGAYQQFEDALQKCAPARADVAAIPLRLIL